MNKIMILFACATLAAGGFPANAADFSDPTWPCIQRKVTGLTPALMWPDIPAETDLPEAQDSAVKELAAALSLQRVDMDHAAELVAEFTAAQGHDATLLAQVFARTFHALETRRGRIINGIGDFSLGQIELSKRVDATRAQMDALMAQDAPDYDKVDALEEQLDWDERIFIDRQQSITYLCETPVLLEKRLFAISQLLQEASRAGG